MRVRFPLLAPHGAVDERFKSPPFHGGERWVQIPPASPKVFIKDKRVEGVENTKGISAERSKNPDDILYADWDSDEDLNEDLLDARLLDAMRLIVDELPNADIWDYD